MKPKKLWRFATALICWNGLAVAEASADDAQGQLRAADQYRAVGQTLQQYVDDGRIPGAVVLIGKDGDLVHAESRGVADIDKRTPIGPSTIFRLYSMTKPITCAAVMTLQEDGLIDIDDPIRGYLPEFTSMSVRTDGGVEAARADITIRHLMTHTSGIGYSTVPSRASADYRRANLFAIENRLLESLEEHVRRLAQLPLAAQPGAAWNYGESMGVLGRLIEVVTGMPFRSYLKKRILAPLKMRDTDFHVPAGKQERLARLYQQDAEAGLRDVTGEPYFGGSFLEKAKLEYGGAGLVGTPLDYARFAQMLLNLGSLDGEQVLSPNSVRMMTTNQLDESFGQHPLASLGRAPGVGFGFCGNVGTIDRSGVVGAAVGEYGWGGWASTKFWIDRRNDEMVLIFTQAIPSELVGFDLGQPVKDAIAGAGKEH